MTDAQQAPDYEQEVAEATPPLEETIEDRKARAREMVPITPGQGITPENYQGFVTVAQGAAKAYLMLPPHLHDNVPVMLGIMDIAVRGDMSSYLFGMQTYVQNGRLCFMAIGFHALARPHLHGGLKGEYVGEGDEMYLIVRGRLKGDPAIYVHESPKLGQLRPPRNDAGVIKGSQLWDRKPRMQLWYDTTRDWIRMYCPQAVCGMRGEDEQDGFETLKDVTPPLRERLAPADRPATGEGFRDGAHVEKEVARARAPLGQDDYTGAEPEQEEPEPPPSRPSAPPKKPRSARQEAAGKPEAKPRPGQRPAGKTVPRSPQAREKARLRNPPPQTRAQVKRAADRAEHPKPPQRSESWRAYVAAALAWIENSTDAAAAETRWLDEKDARDEAGVPIVERHRLKARLDEVCWALGKR